MAEATKSEEEKKQDEEKKKKCLKIRIIEFFQLFISILFIFHLSTRYKF